MTLKQCFIEAKNNQYPKRIIRQGFFYIIPRLSFGFYSNLLVNFVHIFILWAPGPSIIQSVVKRIDAIWEHTPDKYRERLIAFLVWANKYDDIAAMLGHDGE